MKQACACLFACVRTGVCVVGFVFEFGLRIIFIFVSVFECAEAETLHAMAGILIFLHTAILDSVVHHTPFGPCYIHLHGNMAAVGYSHNQMCT